MFEDMMARIDNETIRYLFHIQIQQAQRSRRHADRPTGQRAWRPGPAGAGPQAGSAERHGQCGGPRSARLRPPRWPARAQQCKLRCACATSRGTRSQKQRQQSDLQYQTGPRKPNHRSPSAPPRKSAATILVPAAPAKNTRNATAKAIDRHCSRDVRPMYRRCLHLAAKVSQSSTTTQTSSIVGVAQHSEGNQCRQHRQPSSCPHASQSPA